MIELQNIYKKFHHKTENSFALENINLKINTGELVLLKGQSGCGKSTLLHILASLMKPDSGSVNVNGENIVSFPDLHISHYRKKTLGYMTQSLYLFEELTLKENLLAPLVLETFTTQEMQNAMQKALELSNIAHKAQQKVSTLSSGERARCLLARAIVNDPQIILFDEPTANLDKENTLSFMQTIQTLQGLGKTLIIATHDAQLDALQNITQELRLRDGKIE